MKSILFSVILLFSAKSFSDQYEQLEEEFALKAVRLIKSSLATATFCEPCEEKYARLVDGKKAIAEKIAAEPKHYYVVKINQRIVDLAYLYIRSDEGWINVAFAVGLKPFDVTRNFDSLQIKTTPEDHGP